MPAAAPTSGRPLTADELRRALTGPHCGIIEQVERVPLEPDDLPVTIYGGRLCDTAALGAAPAPVACSGAALDDHAALAACLGEGVERYCAAFERPGALQFGTADSLPGPAVTPDRFPGFTAMQYRGRGFPFRPWHPGLPIGWVAAESLTGSAHVYLPAYQIQHPYRPRPGEPLLAPTLSTGLACGTCLESATRRALLEVVERDAVSVAWLTRYPPPHLHESRVAELPDTVRALLREIRSRGFRLALLDLTTELEIPVCAVLLSGRSSVGQLISFGSAAAPTQAQALGKALVEAVHDRSYVRMLRRQRPGWKCGRRFRNVTGFEDHALLYSAHPELAGALDIWWQGNGSEPHEARPAVGLPELVQRLHDRDFSMYRVALTTPDAAEIGLHVVRVVVTGLQPLHGHHAWAHLAGPRLAHPERVFPQAPPWGSVPLNGYPHPCA